jgi:hypothetical protein
MGQQGGHESGHRGRLPAGDGSGGVVERWGLCSGGSHPVWSVTRRVETKTPAHQTQAPRSLSHWPTPASQTSSSCTRPIHRHSPPTSHSLTAGWSPGQAIPGSSGETRLARSRFPLPGIRARCVPPAVHVPGRRPISRLAWVWERRIELGSRQVQKRRERGSGGNGEGLREVL